MLMGREGACQGCWVWWGCTHFRDANKVLERRMTPGGPAKAWLWVPRSLASGVGLPSAPPCYAMAHVLLFPILQLRKYSSERLLSFPQGTQLRVMEMAGSPAVSDGDGHVCCMRMKGNASSFSHWGIAVIGHKPYVARQPSFRATTAVAPARRESALWVLSCCQGHCCSVPFPRHTAGSVRLRHGLCCSHEFHVPETSWILQKYVLPK